jgi:hypothetical protein
MVGFYRCPECGDCQDRLFEKPDGTVECCFCQKSSPIAAFAAVKKRRLIGQCAHCGQDVPFASSIGIVGPLCPNFECSNYVAVSYGNGFIQPSLVLDLAWNPRLLSRVERIDSRLLFVCCQSKKDFLALRVLQVLAKQDDNRFKFGNSDEYRAALCLDGSHPKYLGFILWTEDKSAVLRQLFIVKGERRKGHAARLVTFWEHGYANKLSDKFGIEDPNETALKLHVKLGHVKIEGSDAVGVKCYFT